MGRTRFAASVFSLIFIMVVRSGVVPASGPEAADLASPVTDWLIGTIDATREVGYNVSVATDPETGHTYISYYEGNDGDLWLARTGAPVGNCGPGNTWECQVIDSLGVVGKFSSIAIGGQRTMASLYISYHDVTNGSLKLLELGVSGETGGIVYTSRYLIDFGDPGGGLIVGKHTSIALDDSGIPHIAYQADIGGARSIRYATPVTTGSGNCGPLDGWMCTTVQHGYDLGEFIDVKLDPTGIPNIAYMDAFAEDVHPVIATPVAFGGTCTSNQWLCVSVQRLGHDTGEYLSLGIGHDGMTHLAYRNATTASLEWARYVGPWQGNCGPGDDSWQCEWIDDIGPGGLPSGIDMETDNNGNPVIVYQDASSGDRNLKIARPLEATSWDPAGNCGPLSPMFFPTWYCETLDAGDINHAEAVGGLSIAMNANGEAAVAYRELFGIPPDEGRLKVAIEPISIFIDGFESGDTSAWATVVP